MWRGRPRPRKLTTRSPDRSLLSLPSRSSPSRSRPRNLRGLRPSLRKKRRAPRRAGRASASLRREHPSPRPRRNHANERPLLPRSRRGGHRRHPPLSRPRHCRSREATSLEPLRGAQITEGAPTFSRFLREGGDFDFPPSANRLARISLPRPLRPSLQYLHHLRQPPLLRLLLLRTGN